jgi:hypothetical protein
MIFWKQKSAVTQCDKSSRIDMTQYESTSVDFTDVRLEEKAQILPTEYYARYQKTGNLSQHCFSIFQGDTP